MVVDKRTGFSFLRPSHGYRSLDVRTTRAGGQAHHVVLGLIV